jgi:hypothetical protein
VDFNQVAMVVEVDEAAIAPHLERLTDVARRHGVPASTELDVVIGMDRAACPRRAIEGLPSLRFRFPGGVARDSGIDDEAAVLRVLEEDTPDRGRIAIGAARTGGNHSRARRRTPSGRKLWRNCCGNTSENQAIARRKECAGKFTLESSSGLWIDHDKALKFT